MDKLTNVQESEPSLQNRRSALEENQLDLPHQGEIKTSAIVEIPHVHIEPSRGWVGLELKDLWIFRELLYFLTWRDVKIRYKQTALGVTWAVLQPFLTMVVFSLFFGKLAKVPSDGVPYPIFNYVGLLPWTFFSSAMTNSSQSLVGNANMITKVYFPRLIVPISAVLSGVVDFAISFVILIGMMFVYPVHPGWGIALLPAFFLLAMVTSLGVGLWLSALNVQYRDVRYIVPFLTQFWLFATPIAYPSTLLSQPWITVYGLNPMAGVVEGFRWALLGTHPPSSMIYLSTLMAIILFVSGLFYYRRMEKNFADLV